MNRKLFALFLILSMLLSGCAWLDGSYVHVTPHQAGGGGNQGEALSAENYSELLGILKDMVAAGKNDCVIYTGDFDGDAMNRGLKMAGDYIRVTDPIGAYAVEDIQYEIGSSSGLPAVSITVAYRHNSTELQRIRRAADSAQARTIVANALEGYETGIVLLVNQYEGTDFSQFVQDYANDHPETIMEVPKVTQEQYGVGDSRVVELIFSYQTSRDSLRRMQAQVKPVFDSAVLYVSGDAEDYQKYSQLYAFLMERFDYKQETSITPAYSLLRHGIGDSRAFAQVYAAMCRDAGLTCMTVTGTRDGEPWTWNILLDGEEYYHVDLLRCSENGQFREQTDEEMDGYVWDYSDYPECTGKPAAVETTAVETQSTENNG